MRHEEDEEEEGGGRKGGRKARMMITTMPRALGICCGDGFSRTRNAIFGLCWSSWGTLGVLVGLFWEIVEPSWGSVGGCLGGLLGQS